MPKARKTEVIKDLETLLRKYRGKASPETAGERAEQQEAVPGGNPTIDPVSVAQTSYVERANTFDRIISFLEMQAGYMPNEADLTGTSLRIMHSILEHSNEATDQAIVNLQTARNKLKVAFDAEDMGLVDIALAVKEAVKSAYGAESFEYRQVSGLSFPRGEE